MVRNFSIIIGWYFYFLLFFEDSELEGTISDEDSSEADMLSLCEDILFRGNEESNSKRGFFFVDVTKGVNCREKDSSSWYNQAEITAVLSFLSKLNETGIDMKNIGVITPYALQVKKLKQKVALGLPDTGLKIGTVEEFQGQERQIILLSTVRSDERYLCIDKNFGLGFLSCEKRLNVAISRARALLVIFGNAKILKADEKWKALIDISIRDGTYSSL